MALYFSVSLPFAVFASVLPSSFRTSPHLTSAIAVSYMASGVWGAVVAFAFVQLGRRAAWLLAGAPFALLWPAVMFWLKFACDVLRDCI